MKKRSKKIFKVTGTVLGSIVLFFVLLLLSLYLILTPKRLTPIVNKYSTQYLNADVTFSSVKLSLFEELPFISLRLTDGNVVSHVFDNEPDSVKILMPIQADSLLQFKELLVSLNLPSLLAGKIDIRRVRLLEPKAYAYVSQSGRASWEIYVSDTTESAPLDINIDRIAVRNSGNIIYHSAGDSMKFSVGIGRLLLRGKFTTNVNEFDLDRVRINDISVSAELEKEKMRAKFVIDTMRVAKELVGGYGVDMLSHITFNIDTTSYCKDLAFELHGGVKMKDKKVMLDEFSLSVSDIKALMNGGVTIDKEVAFSDFSLVANSISVANIISLVPKGLYPQVKNIRTDISVGLDAKVDGVYNATTGELPIFDLNVEIPRGGIYNDATNLKFKNVVVDASFHHDPKNHALTGVVIKKMNIDGAVLSLDAKGNIMNLMKDPDINMSLKGDVSLTKMAGLLKSLYGMDVSGELNMDMMVKSKISYFNMLKIGNAYIRGRLSADNFKLNMPKDTINVELDGAVVRFGAYENKRDTQINKGVQMLRVGVRVATANIKYKKELLLKAKSVKLSLGSAASTLSGSKEQIHPIKGNLEVSRLSCVLEDSSRYSIRDSKINFRVLPSPENKKIPVITLNVDSKGIVFRNDDIRGTLTQSVISVQATINKRIIGAKERNKKRLDSLQRVYPSIERDQLFAHIRKLRTRGVTPDDLKSGDIDFSVDKSVGSLFQRWNVTGDVKAGAGRVTTPYFPLGCRFRDFDINFNTNEIDINNIRLISGKSQLDMQGKISGIRRVLMGRGKLNVNMVIDADVLNMNELIQSANSGMAYMESSEGYKQSIAEAESDEEMQKLIDNNNVSEVSGLIIVPANVDIDVKMRVKQGYYLKLALDTLSVELIARERNLQIKELKAKTDAGALSLTALYSTKSKKDISTGFDLELKDIEVRKLIDLMPSVDTLLPMLRSFEGFITCQIAATAAMDTSMNIILPTLQAACRIDGKNMVLLDGETFSEIAKMMKFKNRDKNKIDRISVEMLVQNNQIEVFPFVMEMDRYKTAISGIHKLDMDFKYHISVLQSPIPFRLGVTISGNTDDMDNIKFKIGKAKYKNTQLPTYTTVIDTTRLNLRRYITDIFKSGVGAANIRNADIVQKVKLPLEDHIVEELSREDSIKLQQEGIIDIKRKSDIGNFDNVEGVKGVKQTKETVLLEDKRKNRKKK